MKPLRLFIPISVFLFTLTPFTISAQEAGLQEHIIKTDKATHRLIRQGLPTLILSTAAGLR
jgi:hypothetical protein